MVTSNIISVKLNFPLLDSKWQKCQIREFLLLVTEDPPVCGRSVSDRFFKKKKPDHDETCKVHRVEPQLHNFWTDAYKGRIFGVKSLINNFCSSKSKSLIFPISCVARANKAILYYETRKIIFIFVHRLAFFSHNYDYGKYSHEAEICSFEYELENFVFLPVKVHPLVHEFKTFFCTVLMRF